MNALNKLTHGSSNTEEVKILLKAIRSTTNEGILGILRLLLGGLFVMTGLMKLFVPMLGEAFSGQLLAANIPFYTFNVWFVPVTEVVVGILLLLGLFSRIGGLVVISMMLVATYVHLVVNNPALFPLQPEEPIIPLVSIAVAAYVVWRGGGAWSMDLKSYFIVKKELKIMSTTANNLGQEQSSSLAKAMGAGAIAGLGGGLVFGIMMGMMGMLPMVGMLIGAQNAVVGFILHMGISAFIGAIFGAIVAWVPAAREYLVIAGGVYGIVWWVLGALILMPLMLGMSGMILAIGGPQWMSLVGHIIYGVITGLLFEPVARRL